MANLVIKDKALLRSQDPDMRMGRYYSPNNSIMQFFQAMKLCVEAISSISRRTRVEPLYGGAT